MRRQRQGGAEVSRERVRCGHKSCRRSLSSFDFEMETPKADGWAQLNDAGGAPRESVWLCPLHNLLVREGLEEGDVRDPAVRR
jgi:hypothetical protein